jgi:hypothetical protein
MRKDKSGFFWHPCQASRSFDRRVWRAFPRLVLVLATLGLLSTLVGCNSSGKDKLIPVSGKVTLDGTALTAGQVAFHPNLEKGNKATGMALGTIGADGTYTLTTNGKTGTPPGWYKVTVATNFPGVPGTPVPINSRYNMPTTSGLACEVVPNAAPGAYDLKVTK